MVIQNFMQIVQYYPWYEVIILLSVAFLGIAWPSVKQQHYVCKSKTEQDEAMLYQYNASCKNLLGVIFGMFIPGYYSRNYSSISQCQFPVMVQSSLMKICTCNVAWSCQLHTKDDRLLRHSPAHGRGSLRMCFSNQFTPSFRMSPPKKEICNEKQNTSAHKPLALLTVGSKTDNMCTHWR